MAILRKGSRIITVGGQTFRWRVRHRPTYCQALGWSGLVLAVELDGHRGAILLVKLSQLHPSRWIGGALEPVLPGMVASYIRKALLLGWKPEMMGKPFLLEERGSPPDSTP